MNLLIVDDEENIRDFLRLGLEKEGYTVFTFATGKEALDAIKNEQVDVCFLDIILPDMDGLDILASIRQTDPNIKIIIITAINDLKLTVKAMKLGAYDYITKPFSFDEIEIAAKSAIDALRAERKLNLLEMEFSRCLMGEFRGDSSKMREVYALIEKAALLEGRTILITGETGTGKSLAARTIHNMSRRADAPFVSVQCTALSENILESELFGHEKGAFTDAKFTRQGLFEFANEGTIFFDEIGDISLKIQSRLLGVLEEKRFRRLGGNKEINVDVNIIAATNKELFREVKEGHFREDLYYRLMVFPIHMPSLRERIEDIPGLTEFFLKRYCQEFAVQQKSFSNEALDALLSYPWPGNVRELKNIIERIVILNEMSVIRTEHLPLELQEKGGLPAEHFKKTILNVKEQYEKNYITSMLTKHRGNVTHASMEAGMDRGSFQRLMRKYSILSESFR
ncbi:MAG: sigma-54 dependent transcriptional regulator, partial [Nitrospirota bacterium]